MILLILPQAAVPRWLFQVYVFDLVGKIKQVSDPTGTYGFAYDNMGRLIGTTTQYSFLPGPTFSNAYTYDAASNRTSLTAPDGSTNTYSYDTLNRFFRGSLDGLHSIFQMLKISLTLSLTC